MTVTALVIGDPHFKVSNVRETDLMSERLLELAREHNPTFLVILGDTLHRHETIHVTPLTRAVRLLRALSESFPTYLLIGNHDLKNNREYLSEEHPFTSLRDWPNCRVIDRPVQETIGGLSFIFVPYVPPGRFAEALQPLDRDGARCLFAHQEFRGCRIGPVISSHGDPWPVHYPLVISGHIHEYQQPQPNLLYVGTPFQHNFGESPDKAIMLVSFGPKETEFLRLPLGLPLKRTLEIRYEEIEETLIETKDELRLIISGTPSQLRTIRKHPRLESWVRQGYRISYKTIPENFPSLLELKKRIIYSRLLLDSLAEEPELIQLYQQIMTE